MRYNYSFDIAALFIEIFVIIFFYYKKYLSIQQNKIFMGFVECLVVVTILDALTSIDVELGGIFPKPVTYIANCVYLMGATSFGVFFTWYTLSLADFWSNLKTKTKKIIYICFLIPYIVVAVLICSTPFFHNPENAVFYLDENNLYHRGTWLFYMLYYVSGFYLFATAVLLVIFRKQIAKAKRNLILFYFLAIIVSVAIQFFYPYLLVECFGLALTALTFQFFIQKPEEVLDPTTELFNQTAFIRMHQGLKTSEEHYVFIGININDIDFLINTFGVRQFNQLLYLVTEYLKQNFNFSNIYSVRQGSFCIVLKNKTTEEISAVISKITNRFRSSWKKDTLELKLYAQICVIDYPSDVKTAEEILDIFSVASTDERYRQPVIYAKNIDIENRRKNAYYEYCVRKGLSENRFVVYYQPIYSAAEKRVVGGEALIRLKDDKGNFISPEVFIPIAEKNGTILRIGEFVFETVCRDLSRVDLNSVGISTIHVNLSVAQCVQDFLADQILTIQTIYRIPVSVLDLEITETALAHTPEIMQKNFEKLVEFGFKFSLDDYGSGYSNMSYMLNMPFSQIKIDKYIVWSAIKEKRAEFALKKTIEMIKALGMSVLAEGVETKEQADWLMDIGCDYLQGYYYSKPVPFTDFLEVFKKTF